MQEEASHSLIHVGWDEVNEEKQGFDSRDKAKHIEMKEDDTLLAERM